MNSAEMRSVLNPDNQKNDDYCNKYDDSDIKDNDDHDNENQDR